LFRVAAKANRIDPKAAAKRLKNQAQSFAAYRSSSRAYRTSESQSGTIFSSKSIGLR
jgi:hypothetical protein